MNAHMKALSQIHRAGSYLQLISILATAAFLGLVACPAATSGSPSDTQTPTAVTSAADPKSVDEHPDAAGLSPSVRDVIKLADAGVAKDVIKAYVESSPVDFQLSADAIIALKKHNVSDEVVTLLVKRGAQARTAIAQAKANLAERAQSTRRYATGGFDPESYEYFQYYYLQPRALASVYQRLSPYYYSPFGYPGGFGYRSPYFNSLAYAGWR